jgi:hypothetical protein
MSTNNCCCDSLADGSEVSLLAFQVIIIALERVGMPMSSCEPNGFGTVFC